VSDNRDTQTAEERDWQRRIYLEAYRAANPNQDDPAVSYENGWWVFRSQWGRVERRVRTKRLAEMTLRLEDRVNGVTNAD
jgi:hypothetical protein